MSAHHCFVRGKYGLPRDFRSEEFDRQAVPDAVRTFFIRVFPEKEASQVRYNPFDLTKVWPKGDSPRRGRRPLEPPSS